MIVSGPAVARWVIREAAEDRQLFGHSLGWLSESGQIVSAFTFEDYKGPGGSVTIHFRAEGPLTKTLLKNFQHYVFEQLKVATVRSIVPAPHKAVRRLARHLGFVEECELPDHFAGGVCGILITLRRDAVYPKFLP